MKVGTILVCAVGTPFAALAGTVPFITTQPTNQIVVPANNATLVVASTNATSYQWRFNGTEVLWGTNATLIITNAQTTDTGYYMVIAKNEMGWTPSQLAYLAVIDVGGTVPFSNLGNTNAQAFYQACGDCGPISNATAQLVAGPELDQMLPVGSPVTVSNGYFHSEDRSVPNVAPGQTAFYRVAITYTNQIGMLYTQISTTLTLVAGGNGHPTPSTGALFFPMYIEWPQPDFYPFCGNGEIRHVTSQTLIPGETARTCLFVSGYMYPSSIQWRKDGAPIATNQSLIITNFQATDVGVYDVQAFTFTAQGAGAGASWKVQFGIQTSNGPGVFRSPRLSGSDFVCDLEGVASRSYGIQWSTNLSMWSNLLTLTNTTGVASFTNSTGASDGRFYRAVLLP
jgi:hypothetical protein